MTWNLCARLLPRCLLLGVLLLGASCSGRKPVYPVTGKVMFQGRPAAGAVVQFHPQDKSDKNPLVPVGQVGPDGSFRLTTYAHEDGASAGRYAVTVFWGCPRRGETATTGSWCQDATLPRPPPG